MKFRKLFSLLPMLPLALCGAVAENPKDIRLENGRVSAAYGEMITLFEDDFAADTGKWQKPYRIFERFSWLHYDKTNGVPTFRIDRNPKRENDKVRLFDTAWGISTKKITLPANSNAWFLTLKAFSNQPEMVNASGGENYGSFVIWYDKDGKPVGDRHRIFYNVGSKFAAVTKHEGRVPAGAAYAVITLGADEPDLAKGEYVAFAGLQFSVAQKAADFKPFGYFETAPVRSGGERVTWEANTPRGTDIALQVAYAKGDIPGEWSAFSGPDGSSKSWFTAQGFSLDAVKGNWAKLRVRLRTAGRKTPELISLTVGNRSLKEWNSFTDQEAPKISRTSVSPCEDPATPCVFQISDDNPVNWKKLKIEMFTDFESKTGNPVNAKDMTAAAKIDGDQVVIAPDGTFSNGLNFFRISVEDILGNSVQEVHVLYIGKRRTENIVTLRDDGMTLIDGKPFFPIGMACAVKDQLNGNSYDRLFEMFQEAGMNFARHYSSFNKHATEAPEYFAAAAKHGIKLYCSAANGANETRIPNLAKALATQLDAPNIAWDTGDDTSMHITKDEMRVRYMAIKAIDPDRVTTQADPLGSFYNTRYKRYALYSDNFSPEIYSVHNASEQDKNQSVPTVIASLKAIHRDVRDVKAPTRSCWPLIHYFYNTGNWKRLPDYTELRAMAFQAVIHGAQGIIFYRYAGYRENNKTGFTPEQWNTVASVAKDLRKVYDVLCARATAEQPTVEITGGPDMDVHKQPSVSTLLKECNGKRYLFVGNGIRKDVTAAVTVAGARGGKELYSNQTVSAKGNGVFALTLKPLEILVFELN